VQVVSLDWKWLFIYPEQHIATVNRLVLPVGQPVHFKLTSSSVMNVFFVPRLAGEIYTMNGMVTQLNLRADKVGTYPGLSAQFSGDGFSSMGFEAEVVSVTDFNQFVGSTRASPGKLDENVYRAISKPSQASPMQVFGTVSDGLFEKVATRRLPAGDGPSSATLAYGAVEGEH
jgi:cytochrome o ubiquinol oxidase subunit 2